MFETKIQKIVSAIDKTLAHNPDQKELTKAKLIAWKHVKKETVLATFDLPHHIKTILYYDPGWHTVTELLHGAKVFVLCESRLPYSSGKTERRHIHLCL